MESELVSIIVPVYNVEEYIEKCINSLIKQDYPNIEIILVDDGSIDQCPQILDTWGKRNPRIYVIHQENRGVSAARNRGLQIAQGKYVMFVDGDDWVDPDYVSYFVSLVTNSNCVIGFNKINYGGNHGKSNEKLCKIKAETAIEWIYSEQVFVAVWNKIYKRDFLEDNQIEFCTDIWYGEGMLFNIECLQYVDYVALGEKCVYHQMFNPNSAMRNFNLNSNYCGIASLWLQRSKWKKMTKSIQKEWEFHRYRFNRSIIDGIVREGMLPEYESVFKECKRNLRRGWTIPMKNKSSMRKKIGWIVYCLFPYHMAQRAKRIWSKQLQDKL